MSTAIAPADANRDGVFVDFLPGAARWSLRLSMTVIVMLCWLGMVTLALAFLVPENRAGNGLATDYPLNVLIGRISIGYMAIIWPFMLFRMRSEEWNTWGVFAVYGWVACLIGSVMYLRFVDVVAMGEFPFEFGIRITSAIVAATFLLPMTASMAIPVNTERRVVALVMLLLGWLVIQGAGLKFMDYHSGNQKLAQVMIAALYVILVLSTILPNIPELRYQLIGFLTLIWCAVVVALLFAQLHMGNLEFVRASGRGAFACLVAAPWVAPFFGWLGMPWLKGQRAAWLSCLLLAAAIVVLLLSTIDCNNHHFLNYVWANYDGPKLF